MNDHDHDFDDLDAMLAALPLEEPPARLHARIMAATVYRPRPAMPAWEIWLIGTFIALAAWLTWVVLSSPHAVARITDSASDVLAGSGLASSSTLLWLGLGVSAALWISQLSVPSTRARAR